VKAVGDGDVEWGSEERSDPDRAKDFNEDVKVEWWKALAMAM